MSLDLPKYAYSCEMSHLWTWLNNPPIGGGGCGGDHRNSLFDSPTRLADPAGEFRSQVKQRLQCGGKVDLCSDMLFAALFVIGGRWRDRRFGGLGGGLNLHHMQALRFQTPRLACLPQRMRGALIGSVSPSVDGEASATWRSSKSRWSEAIVRVYAWVTFYAISIECLIILFRVAMCVWRSATMSELAAIGAGLHD
jgi:hypothetical protein